MSELVLVLDTPLPDILKLGRADDSAVRLDCRQIASNNAGVSVSPRPHLYWCQRSIHRAWWGSCRRVTKVQWCSRRRTCAPLWCQSEEQVLKAQISPLHYEGCFVLDFRSHGCLLLISDNPPTITYLLVNVPRTRTAASSTWRFTITLNAVALLNL